jgi:nitrite reductase (NADH) small subunit
VKFFKAGTIKDFNRSGCIKYKDKQIALTSKEEMNGMRACPHKMEMVIEE